MDADLTDVLDGALIGAKETALQLLSVSGDVLPDFRSVLNWNFPVMIPAMGEGEFHEEVEVLGGTDRLHPTPGR